MENSLLRTYGSKRKLQKNESITDGTERKLYSDGIGSSDSTMYENVDVGKTTIPQTTHPNPSIQRNLIEATMNENKENCLANETVSTFGVSHLLPNSWLSNQSREHGAASIQNDFDPCTTYTCPPLMSFAHSLAFSDISIPFPSLAASNSFDPNGIFHCHNYSCDAAPTKQFSCHPSLEQQECNLAISLIHTPDNIRTNNMQNVPNNLEYSWKNTSGDGTTVSDLNMAASALLELTPTTTQNDQFHRAQLQVTKDCHTKEMSRSRNEQMYCQQNLPLFHHNQHFEETTDEPAYQKLNFPTRARVESRAQALLNDVPYTVQACKCKNSQCLKLYCACFQQGTFCDELVCSCRKCENTAKHSMPRGSRTRAIYEILNRRIDAFEARERKRTGNGCSCKKSKCLQKYCNCFANAEFCSGICCCYGCENIKIDLPSTYETIALSILNET